MARLLILVVSLLFFGGCAYHPPLHADNIIAVDTYGRPENVKNGKVLSFHEYSTNINKSFSQAAGKTILIHIHGGLNMEEGSNERADIIATTLERGTQYYPFFIHWKSGPFTSLREHIFNDRQGTYWKTAGWLSFPFVLASDLGRGIIRAPMVWWYQANSYQQTLPLTREMYPSQKNALKISDKFNQDKDGLAEVPQFYKDTRGKWTTFKDSVVGGLKFGMGLTTAPVFDALGTGAWQNMKRRTDVALFSTEYPEKDELKRAMKSSTTYADSREGGVYTFFRLLERRQKADPNLRVVLVGHSMGTIIASKVLREFPSINYERIIFMAAACTLDDFRGGVLPHLTKPESTTEFYNLMLHPLAENQEAHGFGLGGTGTLLNQIDSIYEDPVSENTRTLGRFINVMNNINYFTTGLSGTTRKKIHLRTMPLDDAYPQKHGEFGKVISVDDPKDPAYPGCLGFEPPFWDKDFGTIPSRRISTCSSTVVKAPFALPDPRQP